MKVHEDYKILTQLDQNSHYSIELVDESQPTEIFKLAVRERSFEEPRLASQKWGDFPFLCYLHTYGIPIVQIFLTIFLMNFLTNFLTYNLLTVASFRIGVPSILFICNPLKIF